MHYMKKYIALLLTILVFFSATGFAGIDTEPGLPEEQIENQESEPYEQPEPEPYEQPEPEPEPEPGNDGEEPAQEDETEPIEEQDETQLEDMDYYLSLLQLDKYTFRMSSDQNLAKAFVRREVPNYNKLTDGVDFVVQEAMVAVRSEEEARQVAEACLGRLVEYNGEGYALIELSGIIPDKIMFELTARPDVPLPALEPNLIFYPYFSSVDYPFPDDDYDYIDPDDFSFPGDDFSFPGDDFYFPGDDFSFPDDEYSLGMQSSSVTTSSINGDINTAFPNQYHHRSGFLNTAEAWRTTRGAGAVVAVIDSGLDTSHPKFAGRIDSKSAFISITGQRKTGIRNINDPDGHGTHVAGTVAASHLGDPRCAGVAPEARLLIVQMEMVYPWGFDEPIFTGFTIIAAMNYVASQKNVHIVNMSFGGDSPSPAIHTAVKKMANSGKLLIAAAGNASTSVGYPAQYPEVIAVSATTSGNALASYSNRGISGTSIQIAAPGSGIYAPWSSTAAPFTQYHTIDGTSMASPNVAGVAALIKSAFPNYTAAQIREKLLTTARRTAPYNNATNFGSGLAWASEAVKGTTGTITSFGTPTVPNLRATISSPTSNMLRWTNSKGAATRYEIFRSTANVPIEQMTRVREVTGTEFEDTGLVFGQRYFYRVRAVFGPNAANARVSAVRNVTTAWPVLRISDTVQAGPDRVRLTWNSITGVNRYTVTRSIGKIVDREISIPATDARLTHAYVTVKGITTPTVTFEDSGLSQNTRYTYTVQAHTSSGLDSRVSASRTIQPGWAKLRLTATSGAYVTGSNRNYTLNVTWNTAPNATQYELQWSSPSKTDWQNATGVNVANRAWSRAFPAGQPVYLRIRAVSGSYQGPWSNTLTTRTIPEPPGFYVFTAAGTGGTGIIMLPNAWYTRHVGIFYSNSMLGSSPGSTSRRADGFEIWGSTNKGKSFKRISMRENYNSNLPGTAIVGTSGIFRDAFYRDLKVRKGMNQLQLWNHQDRHVYKVRSYVMYGGRKVYSGFYIPNGIGWPFGDDMPELHDIHLPMSEDFRPMDMQEGFGFDLPGIGRPD